MIYHPKTILDLGIMREEELRAESQRYRLAAQAVSLPGYQTQPRVRVRTGFASYVIAFRTRIRDLIAPAMVRPLMEPGAATRDGGCESHSSLPIG